MHTDHNIIERLKESVQVDIQWTESGGYEPPPQGSRSTRPENTLKDVSTSLKATATEATINTTPNTTTDTEGGAESRDEPYWPGIHPSVVIYMPSGEPPRALITDATGAMLPKVVSCLDILYMLEESATIKEISRDPVQTKEIPPLPEGALLITTNERLYGTSYTVTGVLPPERHTFPIDDKATCVSQIFEISMPHIVYRITWDDNKNTISSFALAIISPDHTGAVTRETEVYAYPFSNTYDTHDGILEGVCWPVKNQIQTTLEEVPNRIVRTFLGSPNTTSYTRDVAGLVEELGLDSYADLLRTAEESGSLPHDWLKPAAMNIQQLHDQKRRP